MEHVCRESSINANLTIILREKEAAKFADRLPSVLIGNFESLRLAA